MSAPMASDNEQSLEDVFRGADDPVLTAVEVAERMGVSQQAAHRKLSDAHEEDTVKRKKAGARAVVWWMDDYLVNSR